MSQVDFEGIARTAHGRYRLVCATMLIGEIIRRGWVTDLGFSVDRARCANDRRAFEQEHGFEAPDPEDNVDIALALILHSAHRNGQTVPADQEIAVRKLLVIADAHLRSSDGDPV